jgi:hypothetical protein
MKRLLAFALVAAVLAVPAGQANAAAGPSTVVLSKKITALQKTVKKLRTDVNLLLGVTGGLIALLQCQTAATADAFQGTWTVMDQVAGRTIFGPQAPISDFNSCQQFRTPITRSFAVPPTTSVFSAINALIGAYAYTYPS